ncbi:UvrD-helicase domain-containing protein [Paenalcaligenes sp. Me52]|uniref:UvrD-helicase domain-containing protein n=1 Tax=Paenalcaligenes sp. Me52 TaxID=3392038 RepID=UPI003D2696A7
MSDYQSLTEEQKAFVAHVGGTFVHACPGAGKTHTILARLARIATTLPPRHGVAILSFTNSAVDEFRKRCQIAGLDQLLKHPSFMGTLDSFVRHFVVLPNCVATSTIRPIILDSWDTLGIEIRLAGEFAFRGDAVSLDLFDPETNIIDPERIEHSELKKHVRLHQTRYQRVAANKRRGLLQAGYMSAHDARTRTLELIQNPVVGGALGRSLAARFHEIMVDEGQDCNPLDLQILTWLKAYGVNITFVCDPDQAIYEFRNSNPAGIHEFKGAYPIESHLKLTGNFRSSPVICRLAATLRNSGQEDQSVGDTSTVEHPICLLAYKGQSPTAAIGQAFLDSVTEFGLDAKNAIILAHSGKFAQRAVGATINDSKGSSRIELLARQVAAFWSPAATARSRETILQAAETTLLDLMGLRQPNEHLLRTVERLALDRRAHRRQALSLLMGLPKECEDSDADRLAWIASAHETVEQLALPLPTGVTVRNFFRRPTSAQWSKHLQTPTDSPLKCAKIHEVKGHEFDAVCLVIPPNRAPKNRTEALFSSWETLADAEAKRVLYVGLTRAKQLGALAVPTAFADRCIAIMTAAQVPYVRKNL